MSGLRTFYKGLKQNLVQDAQLYESNPQLSIKQGTSDVARWSLNWNEWDALKTKVESLRPVTPPPTPTPTPTPTPPPSDSSWPFSVAKPVRPSTVTKQGGTAGGTFNTSNSLYKDVAFGYVNINGGNNIWIEGGSFGPSNDGSHPAISNGFQTSVAKNVVLDGVHIHGMHQGTTADHTEGLQVGGVEVLWIKNCVFDDNHIFNLFLRCWSPAPIKYVLIENNKFYTAGTLQGGNSYYALRVAGDGDSTVPTDVVIRNNQIPKNQGISVDGSAVRVVQQNNQAVL